MTTILALDVSSTSIGVCYDGAPHPTWKLRAKDDIAVRCATARALLAAFIAATPDIDIIVIEEPVAKFAKAVIPQASVQGALLSLIAEHGMAYVKIAPSVAKKALTGRGNADKAQMIALASAACAQSLDEHAADAFGLWLAGGALGVKVELHKVQP